jgi:ankyrin repeat protein
LHAACIEGKVEAVKLLLEKGANVELTNIVREREKSCGVDTFYSRDI